ncbi:MAG: AraC family transcriptional regulator [Bacteroides sp.]|uniref:AraC family transcriptional regulator n=1 Tax=Bacteroides sp. TaxID=29523 RepID=UPI002FC96398
MVKQKDGFHGEQALILPPAIVQRMKTEPSTSLLYITDIGFYPKAFNHFRERTTAIEQYIFIYCTEGKGWYSLGGQKYNVNSNQYFILPAHIPHAYGSDEKNPWTIYWIHFSGSLAPTFCTPTICRLTEIKPGMHSRIHYRTELFEEIFRILKMGYSLENISYATSVFHHYLGSLRYLQQYRDASSDPHLQDDTDPVNAAIYYMKEKLDKKITLNELAGYTGYSSSHFSTLFLQRTGYAPLHYFNQIKIQKACQLLDFTDMKINQVCYKIGIEDAYYFSRLFSQVMGVSPKEYRRIKKG